MKLFEIAAIMHQHGILKGKAHEAAWAKMSAKERMTLHQLPSSVYMDDEGDGLVVVFEHRETYGGGNFEVVLTQAEAEAL
jgi:hypothetical protein